MPPQLVNSRRFSRFPFGRYIVKPAIVILALAVSPPIGEPMSMGLDFGGTDPPPAPAPAFKSAVVDQFGGLKRPTRIAISKDGEIFVSDPVQGVVAILDTYGRRIGTLSGLAEPLGVAQSQETRRARSTGWSCAPRPMVTTDLAYVGDQGDGSVRVFENRKLVRALGIGAGEFIKPNGIAVTAQQVAYVIDSGANQVKVFHADGTLYKSFGSFGIGDGQFDFPTDIALNEEAGEVYVSDFGNARIVVFDLQGGWLRDLAPPENDQGDPTFYRIAGLGINPNGNLYVVDSALGSVTIIRPDGTLVDIIGYQLGTYGTGELDIPVDVTTDGSYLYVTSSRDRRVKVFAEVNP